MEFVTVLMEVLNKNIHYNPILWIKQYIDNKDKHSFHNKYT